MSEQNQLPFMPAGWERTALEEICFVNPRWWDFDLNDDDLISFVPMAAVEEETGRLDASIVRKWEEVKQGYTRFQENDVLFAKITPSMENGKAAVAVNLWEGRGVGSTEFHVLRPTSGILPKQVLYFLLQKNFREAARRAMKGVAGQLRVPPEFVAQTTFPLPPLAEQQRIVDEIEKQFSRLDAAVEMLRRVERNLERLRVATLKAAVEGRLVPTEAELAHAEGRDYEPADVLLQRILRERRAKWEADQLAKMKEQGKTPKDDKWKDKYPKPALPNTRDLYTPIEGWTWASLDQCASRITDGTHQPPPFTDDGIPFIFVRNIVGGEISFGETRFISRDTYEVLNARCPIEKGDILYSAVGSYGVAVPVLTDRPFSFQRHIAHIKPLESVAQMYFAHCLNSPFVKNQAHRVARGVAQKTVTLGDLARFVIPLPPAAEQYRIADEIERRISVIEELKTLVTNALRRAAVLRQRILRDAFAGKLVPQDPADEPASLLLERIRAERAAREAEARPARKGRRGKMKGRKAKPSERKTRRALREVVAESKRRLTPEQLFAEAGFTPEVVEDFYEELRREIKTGHIEQVRPDNSKVYLLAANT